MKIDLRSDTLTQPTPAMREAMFSAKVGDDVYGEDESINTLEEKVANYFGKEAALFCPSGTMTNQIAIRILTQLQDEVICFEGSHIYKYEGGGLFSNAGVSVRLIAAERGILHPDQVEASVQPDDVHFPHSRVLALENTVNRGGGSCYYLRDIAPLHHVAQQHDLSMHLDGARLMNALVATRESPQEHARYFDTISLCLSKSLGCPVGSVLLASRALIKKARRVRKVMGGGMRQAGFLAAAGIYALDHHVNRLEEDHRRAKILGKWLEEKPYVREVMPVETNIVIARFEEEEVFSQLLANFKSQDILVSRLDPKSLRMVTHLDINDPMLDRIEQVLNRFEGKKVSTT